MKRYTEYLKYVLRHKWFVLVEGFKLGVPLLNLLIHDWDKFLPDEFFAYAQAFYKPDGTKQHVESSDFAYAWMLHQHRNRHHWQYWLVLNPVASKAAILLCTSDYLVWDRGELDRLVRKYHEYGERVEWQKILANEVNILPMDMPEVDKLEMLADWRGAGRALGKPDTREWYAKNRSSMILHPDTRQWFDERLDFTL